MTKDNSKDFLASLPFPEKEYELLVEYLGQMQDLSKVKDMNQQQFDEYIGPINRIENLGVKACELRCKLTDEHVKIAFKRGEIIHKALFDRPHRDVALYCARKGGAEQEELMNHFGREAPLEELISDQILTKAGSLYRISEGILELYKGWKLIETE